MASVFYAEFHCKAHYAEFRYAYARSCNAERCCTDCRRAVYPISRSQDGLKRNEKVIYSVCTVTVGWIF
jgi:hypothetical protein